MRCTCPTTGPAARSTVSETGVTDCVTVRCTCPTTGPAARSTVSETGATDSVTVFCAGTGRSSGGALCLATSAGAAICVSAGAATCFTAFSALGAPGDASTGTGGPSARAAPISANHNSAVNASARPILRTSSRLALALIEILPSLAKLVVDGYRGNLATITPRWASFRQTALPKAGPLLPHGPRRCPELLPSDPRMSENTPSRTYEGVGALCFSGGRARAPRGCAAARRAERPARGRPAPPGRRSAARSGGPGGARRTRRRAR